MASRDFRCIEGRGWLGGVCAGFAYALGIRTWIVRFALVFSVLFFGFGILLYILLWIFVPNWSATPKDYEAICE